jgi:uncharacterized protein (TIGR02996 family)
MAVREGRRPAVIDKSQWGPGEWQDEPDRKAWVHLGFPCVVARGPSHGALCGYVGVLPGHPWHGRGYHDIDTADVHGGLTWASESDEVRYFLPEPRHPDEAGFRAALLADPNDETAALVYADWLREHDREEEEVLLRRRGELHWFGFDCAHAFDVSPAYDFRSRLFREIADVPRPAALDQYRDVYRNMAYAAAECESLAGQAAKAAVDAGRGGG